MVFFADNQAAGAQRYREARAKRPYRGVPYVFVSLSRQGADGELALEVFRARYRGLRPRSPDLPLLNRLLGGDSPTHGELLSYLFFDPDFIEALSHWAATTRRAGCRRLPARKSPGRYGPSTPSSARATPVPRRQPHRARDAARELRLMHDASTCADSVKVAIAMMGVLMVRATMHRT